MPKLFSVVYLSLLILTTTSSAQSIVVTTKSFAATQIGAMGSFLPQELAYVDSFMGPAKHYVPQTAFNTFLGDSNGDFMLNDFAENIDAIAPIPSPTPTDVLGLYFSVDQTLKVQGTQVKDGDIFTIQGQGGVSVIYTEDLFANATQTTTVDVDAFHEASDGSLFFSFANDEVSTSPSLISANGGLTTMDESMVFTLPAGASTASILYTRADILQFVNNAMGSSLSTIVDLTGFSPDPNFPGEWLFAVGSANSLIEGIVFSTANGGSVAQHFGAPIDSNLFGFIGQEILEGLAILPHDTQELLLLGPQTVQSPAGFHAYEFGGATPHSLVQLFCSNSLFPTPHTEPIVGYAGFPHLYVNPADPLFAVTSTSLDFSRYADSAGFGRIDFVTSHLPVGLRITMQAVDIATLRVSMPASAGI